jgi:exodeoxyribonuclease III
LGIVDNAAAFVRRLGPGAGIDLCQQFGRRRPSSSAWNLRRHPTFRKAVGAQKYRDGEKSGVSFPASRERSTGQARIFAPGCFMKIASYNVNGINGRLDVLVRWLKADAPDIVCLQELKAENAKFPKKEIERAGYRALWHGQKSWNGVAILAKGTLPVLTRRGLPGDPDDSDSRYIEAAVNGLLIGCLYVPNGNPAPGPKFDYKLRWFQRLQDYAAELLELGVPALLIGDYNVMPTEIDVYKPERWRDDALFRQEVRKAYARLIKQGWTDAVRHLHPGERIYTFWKYWRNSFERDAGLRIDHFLLSPSVAAMLKSANVCRTPRSWDHTSDHAPVMIELALEEPSTEE